MSSHCTDRCIVIGGSWGGVTAILRLVASLPAAFPAPILVVQHIGPHPSQLDRLISQQGPNPGKFPEDGEPVRAGTIYVAPPDRHMIVDGGAIRLLNGPKENHARPSIDPLFRSAALAYRERCIGVILTGLLDDGTAGLAAIKACGGTTVVQDPKDAEEAAMPLSAIANVKIDHVVTLDALGALLTDLAHIAPARAVAQPPDEVRREHAVSQGLDIMENLEKIAQPSALTCPDCGGALFELHDAQPVRFRCHVGHGFTLGTLADMQAQTAEELLWAALRALNEKAAILRRAAQAMAGRDAAGVDRALRDADRLAEAGDRLRELIQDDAKSPRDRPAPA